MGAPTGIPVPASRLTAVGRPHRVDYHAGKSVADGLLAEAFHLLARGVGVEKSMVDDGGQRLPVGKSFGGKSGRIEGSVVKFQV